MRVMGNLLRILWNSIQECVMNEDKKHVVDGIKYPNDSEALKAVNEINGIKYVREKTDMSNPKLVLNVYNKMLDKKLFTTVSGYRFLMELRDVLLKSNEIDKDQIRPIEAPSFGGESFAERKRSESPYKSKFINSLIINILFVITIIAMVFITTNSRNVNILNYKSRLESMYNEKENEIARLNSQLKEKEESLNKRENQMEQDTTIDETTESNEE